MKACFKLSLLAFVLFTIPACANIDPGSATPTPVPYGQEIRGVFMGNTPCTAGVRPLLQIPEEARCEQIIWSLVLRQDPQTGDLMTYRLKTSYGLSKQGTNELIGGGTPVSMEGTWTITSGTKDNPEAVVYQLDPGDPQTAISFLKVNDDLIHVLDREKSMLVGDGAWSYTLNRMGHQSPAQARERPWWSPNPPTRPPAPPMPAGSTVFGIFDGRTPCHEVALEFTGTASSDCLKIKWRLTLYQDNDTGESNRYLYMSTSAYQEGSWKIVHGMDGDREAILYQMQPDGAQRSYHFLKMDDNHLLLMDHDLNLLVGNELFSYTLSRKDPGAP